MKDILSALQLWRLWGFWGWLDVRQRYRRSLLGPIWVTMTMGVTILVTGLVYAYLFKQSVAGYLPYVAVGTVLWALISGYISESCSVFIQNEAFMSQLSLSYLTYPLRLLWRYIIIFLHHLVVLVIVVAFFSDKYWLAPISLVLGFSSIAINIFWMGVFLGLISIRVRDLPVFVGTLIQLAFTITPIIWPASALGSYAYLVDWNPFYHLIECIRGPLFNETMPIFNKHLITSLAMALIGSLFTLGLYVRWRRRLLYWL